MKRRNRTKINFVQRLRPALFLLGLLLAGCGASRGVLEQTIEETLQIYPTASVTIDNGDGSIRIYGAPASEMRVKAIKRAYTADRLKKIDVKISAQLNSVSIQTSFPPKPKWGITDRSGTVDYVIVVPDTVSLARVKLDTGEILLKEMRGQETHAQLGTGRLFVHDCFSNLHLGVNTGPLNLIYDWWEPQKFSVQANVNNGSAVAWVPGQASFHLAAKAPVIWNDFSPQRKVDSGKIDSFIGPNPTASFTIDVEDGSIRIFKAFP